MLGSGKPPISKAVFLLRSRKFLTLARLMATSLRRRFNSALRREFMDKGSKRLIKSLRAARPNEPFFAFINIMEAHEPYSSAEAKSVSDILPLSILGRPSVAVKWKKSYPSHANLAVRRVVDIVDLLRKDDTLIIVTSDHGQLLGEKNRFGHGYYLADELLRVPLYVKYPPGVLPFPQSRPLISLAEINRIVLSAAMSGRAELGSEYVLAESFGSQNDLSRFTSDRAVVDSVYSRRVRVFSAKGSIVYNSSTKAVEENEGGLSEEETLKLVELIKPVGPSAPSAGPSRRPATLSSEDEELVSRRLKALGYV